MVSRLVAAPSRLLQFPEVGRVVPEFGDTLRELIVRPYRLVYRLRREFVEITGSRTQVPDLQQ